MATTNAKLQQITDIQKSITEFEGNFQEFNTRIETIETTLKSETEQLFVMEAKSQEQDKKIEFLEKSNKEFQDQLLYAECHSRRDNLQFTGVKENKHENCEEVIIIICQNAGLDIGPLSIARAHRLGGYDRNRNRPIIVKFQHYKARQLVWSFRKYIREHQHVGISEDYPQEIQKRRSILFPILSAAYKFRDPQNPFFRFHARLVQIDKLVVNGKLYTVDTLHSLPKELHPETLATPRTDDTVVFFTKASPLSNHFPCNFKVDTTHYSSMEQYIMQSKALHFQDTDIAAKVMSTTDPVQQKRYGKMIFDFDKKEWQKAIPEILLKGLTAKFMQNSHCKEFLLNTGDRVIGEANKYDSFFGIGKGLHEFDVWDKGQWANNELGKSLMAVREELK
jgi:hypothetical protein